MSSEPLTVTGRFDGGNPQDPGVIERLGPAEFRVTPSSEDGDPNYRFNLNVKLTNEEPEPVVARLHLNWSEQEFNQYRRFVRIEHDGREQRLAATERGRTVSVSFDAMPGETSVFLNRPYSRGQMMAYVESVKNAGLLNVSECGETDAGRPIPLVAGKNADTQPARLMAVGRVHPYETAASYVAEGMIGALGKMPCDETGVGVTIVPMAAPDGVRDGCCKLNGPGGIDLSREIRLSDSGCAALVKTIDQFQPTFLVELHSWMLQDQDGLYYERRRLMRRIARAVEARQGTRRRWSFGVRRRFFAGQLGGLKGYAQKVCGARAMTIEYPWDCRTADQMRSLGADTLRAFVDMLAN